MLQAVNVTRFELPSNDRVNIRVTGVPGLNHQAWRIEFKILAFHAELPAVNADAFAEPFSAGPDVALSVGQTIETFLSPPFCSLRGIGDGCKDASGRSSNEYFCDDGIVVGSDARGGHSFPCFKSLASFYERFQPAERCAPAGIVTLSLIDVSGE